MKVRIKEPALSNYTGKLYEIDFTDGVSDRDLTDQEVAIIGAAMKVEDLDGHQVGAGVSYVQTRRIYLGDAIQINEEVVSDTLGGLVVGNDGDILLVDDSAYTREQLETVADEEGIAGLRAIAEPMGVTGRSIVELIDRILEAQIPSEEQPSS